MDIADREWDFFIAHSSKNTSLAEQLFDLLTGVARAFLDVRSLEPGMEWDKVLPIAQRKSKATIVLVSESTDEAYYERAEVRQAIDLSRSGSHLVIPVFASDGAKGGVTAQYGLSLKQSITLSEHVSLEAAAYRLLALLRRQQFSGVLFDSAEGAAGHFRGYNNSFWTGTGQESRPEGPVSDGTLNVELGGVIKLTRATSHGRLEAQLMDGEVAVGMNKRRIFPPRAGTNGERSLWIRLECKTDGTRQTIRMVLKCESTGRWLASEKHELRASNPSFEDRNAVKQAMARLRAIFLGQFVPM